MPKDADFGRDLAEQLTAEFLGKIGTVEFTYDPYLELDNLPETKPFAKISVSGYQHIRESRNHWREECTLYFSLVSPVGPTDNAQWIDDWLNSLDIVLRFARDAIVQGQRMTSVEIDERYDVEMFFNNRRLVTQAAFNFTNVEVN